jgi:chaperone required for assembly of F1-ATPase
MRRKYRTVEVLPRQDGFGVALDGKAIRTPAGNPLTLPSEALAQAVAEEWQGQDATVRPVTMPLTTLATTAIDRLVPDPGPAIAEIAAYAGSELLCHRAGRPQELVSLQIEGWQPWLDWAETRFGAWLAVGEGIVPLAQTPEALSAIRTAVARHRDLALMALQALTQSLGSVVLALAVVEGALDAHAAAELALLDELYQARLWGEDPEAVRRRAAVRADIEASARFLTLARAE